MNMTVLDRQPDADRRRAISASSIATCIPTSNRPNDFDPFLSERWRSIARRSAAGRVRRSAKPPNYPRMSPGVGMRMDAWPKDGGHPGSDLPMMQEQLLDLFGVAYGLLRRWSAAAADERNVEFGAAMATAANEWQVAHVVRSASRG